MSKMGIIFDQHPQYVSGLKGKSGKLQPQMEYCAIFSKHLLLSLLLIPVATLFLSLPIIE